MNGDKEREEREAHATLERKISIMRERFMKLQSLEQPDDAGDGDMVDAPPVVASNTPKETVATQRWNKIRMVVRSHKTKTSFPTNMSPGSPGLSSSSFLITGDSSPRGSPRSNAGNSPRSPRSPRTPGASVSSKALTKALEMEDIDLLPIWNDDSHINEFNIQGLTAPNLVIVDEAQTDEEDFLKGSVTNKMDLYRIPEEVVEERKNAIEETALIEKKNAIDSIKKAQIDVIHRENLGRNRVQSLEQKVREKQRKEREKLIQLAREKETQIALQFRKAREDLEAGIKRQQGSVKEDFGSLLIHEESIARKFHVFYRMVPQPMEFRIHLLRAVKNKLPKGAYALMLTMYDRLGGYPLCWSHIGATGIGARRPGITKVVKHQGRYFDRILRVEDSVFALCPPRPLLKPGFVFVLELFQLANFRNPEEKIVGWTALPMSFESMSLIEGKFKLPLLRGEHAGGGGGGVTHFRQMEECISRDLDFWLCNIYIEVRQMRWEELGVGDEGGVKGGVGVSSVDFDLDYLNKSVKIKDPVAGSEGNKGTPAQATPSLFLPNTVLLQKQPPSSSLGMDKGIFRRKISSAKGGDGGLAEDPSPIFRSKGTDGSKDIESGLGESGSVHSTNKHKDDDKTAGQTPLHPAAPSVFSVAYWKNLVTGGGGRVAASNPTSNSAASKSSATPDLPLLTPDENFLEHRKKILRKWKENLATKYIAAGDPKQAMSSNTDIQDVVVPVRERGYNLQDEVFLHKQQRGKLGGVESLDAFEARQWAAAGLEGKIVRRWQADGSRFDSDAIDDASPNASPHPHATPTPKGGGAFFPPTVANKALGGGRWEELRDVREMQEYTMAVASDPTTRKHLMPGAITRSKLRYLSLELFGDLVPFLFGTFEFYSSVFLYLFALWMRIYVHYLAQYLFLLSRGTPVYDFHLRVLFVSFKYMSPALSTSVEVGVVAIGPIANIAVFLLLVVFGRLFYKYSGFLPDVFSKFFAFFGLAAVLNPLLILIVDLAYHNYNCPSVSAECAADYTSSDCECFSGDFVKLWYRMLRIEGSGLTGLIITSMLYLGCGVLALCIVYEYLLHVHRDGRILDLWRRINAPYDEFFIPDDFEISADELQEILNKAKTWKGPVKARRRVFVQEGKETDPFNSNFNQTYKRYIIYETSADGKQTSVHRQFLLDSDGKIVEIFSDFKRKRAQQRAFNLDREAAFGGDKAGKGEEVAQEEELEDNDNDDGDDVADVHESGEEDDGDDTATLPRRSPRPQDHSEEDAHRFAKNSYDEDDNFEEHSEGGLPPLAPR